MESAELRTGAWDRLPEAVVCPCLLFDDVIDCQRPFLADGSLVTNHTLSPLSISTVIFFCNGQKKPTIVTINKRWCAFFFAINHVWKGRIAIYLSFDIFYPLQSLPSQPCFCWLCYFFCFLFFGHDLLFLFCPFETTVINRFWLLGPNHIFDILVKGAYLGFRGQKTYVLIETGRKQGNTIRRQYYGMVEF